MKKFQKTLIILFVVIMALLVLFLVPESKKELKTEHFKFLYSADIDPKKIEMLAHALEENYIRIGNDLKTKPADLIETNIYSQRWRYIKATGNWGASGSIEGTATLHFLEHAWGESVSQKVAIHEFAHTVTLKLLLDHEIPPISPKDFDKKFATFPVWLWEAVSVFEADQLVDPGSLPYLANGQYPRIPELNNRLKGGKIYSCGYTIVEYILSAYGQDNLIRLIQNYGDVDRTFQVTEEQLSKDWYRFVKRNT